MDYESTALTAELRAQLVGKSNVAGFLRSLNHITFVGGSVALTLDMSRFGSCPDSLGRVGLSCSGRAAPSRWGTRFVASIVVQAERVNLASPKNRNEGLQSLGRRASMSLRRLCWFTLALTLAGATTVETLNVQIQEYEVPTPKSRPHDPALAPDGSLWYTGQGANKLGRLDPKTGEFKEYPLKTPNSGPHGLVADKDGNIWFTAISGGYVGRLDPKTSEISEYRPDDGTEIDPHTPVFDRNGVLWFTNEQTNYIGRLDPKTGKMILTKVPTSHAVPYGIVILQNNTPLFCEFGTNKLASIDPNTMKIRRQLASSGCAPPADRASA